jgi:hypothetical protein
MPLHLRRRTFLPSDHLYYFRSLGSPLPSHLPTIPSCSHPDSFRLMTLPSPPLHRSCGKADVLPSPSLRASSLRWPITCVSSSYLPNSTTIKFATSAFQAIRHLGNSTSSEALFSRRRNMPTPSSSSSPLSERRASALAFVMHALIQQRGSPPMVPHGALSYFIILFNYYIYTLIRCWVFYAVL